MMCVLDFLSKSTSTRSNRPERYSFRILGDRDCNPTRPAPHRAFPADYFAASCGDAHEFLTQTGSSDNRSYSPQRSWTQI